MMRNRKLTLDEISRIWHTTSDSKRVLTALSDQWPELFKHVYYCNTNDMTKLLDLLRFLAMHQNTDPKELILLLKAHDKSSGMNLGTQSTSWMDWSHTRQYLNILSELAIRKDVGKEDLLPLLHHQYTYVDRYNGKKSPATFISDLIIMGDEKNLQTFLHLLTEANKKYKFSDDEILQLIAIPNQMKSIGQLISDKYSNPTALYLLAYLLADLKKTDFRPFMPTSYGYFLAKEEMYKIIKGLPPKHRLAACKDALNPDHPLFFLIGIKRNFGKCKLNKGTYLKIQQLRDKTETELAAISKHGMYAPRKAEQQQPRLESTNDNRKSI